MALPVGRIVKSFEYNSSLALMTRYTIGSPKCGYGLWKGLVVRIREEYMA